MSILIISTIHDLYFTLTFTEYSRHIQCTHLTSMRHYTYLIDHVTQQLHIGILTYIYTFMNEIPMTSTFSLIDIYL